MKRSDTITLTALLGLLLSLILSAPGVAAPVDLEPALQSLALGPCGDDSPIAAQRTVVRWIGDSFHRWIEIDQADGDRCGVLVAPQVLALDAEGITNLYRENPADPSTRIVSAVQLNRTRRTPERDQRLTRTAPASLDRALAAATSTSGAPRAVRKHLTPERLTADVRTPGRSESRLVFGADNRQRVIDSDDFPFSNMVFVESEFPDQSILGFSGFLAGPYTVITAAQALFQDARGVGNDDFAVSIQVWPGQTQFPNGDVFEPFGSQFAVDLVVPSDWVDFEAADANYGAVFLDEPFAGINNFPAIVFNATPNGTVGLSGYDLDPQDEVGSLALWNRTGSVLAFDAQFTDYLLDTDEGTIGAPLRDAQNRVFALDCCVAEDQQTNVGVRFTSDNQALVSEWVAFEPNGGGGNPTGDALLLDGGRFEVRVAFRDQRGTEGDGVPTVLTADTGFFWFFSPSNVEMVIKVLDGCGLNDRYWVFAGGLTNVATTIEVIDLIGDEVRTYTTPLGPAFTPIQDTDAFATCP